MTCPKCSQEMFVVSESVTNDGGKGAAMKQYDRTINQCESCDIWITVEIPQKKSSKK